MADPVPGVKVTAFQRNAFQNNAFEIAPIVYPVNRFSPGGEWQKLDRVMEPDRLKPNWDRR